MAAKQSAATPTTAQARLQSPACSQTTKIILGGLIELWLLLVLLLLAVETQAGYALMVTYVLRSTALVCFRVHASTSPFARQVKFVEANICSAEMLHRARRLKRKLIPLATQCSCQVSSMP